MGLLVTGVTRIVEKIYVITCLRPGWYKLFPQLFISFSFDFARSRGHPSKGTGTSYRIYTWRHGCHIGVPNKSFPTFNTLSVFSYLTCFAYLMHSAYLLELLCLLEVLCLLEMFCLLDVLCLLEIWKEVKDRPARTACGFCGCVALSNAFELHFCSNRRVFQRFTSFVAYDQRTSTN